MTRSLRYYDMLDIRGDSRTSKWFANGPFHGSRPSSHGYEADDGTVYFVDRTKNHDGSRGYSVMSYDPTTGRIDLAGEVREYGTSSGAHRRAQSLSLHDRCIMVEQSSNYDGTHVCQCRICGRVATLKE